MYKRIMVVVDDDEVTRGAIAEGVETARAHGAEVLFFHVLPNYVLPVAAADMVPLDYVTPQEHQHTVEGRAKRVLADAAAVAERHGVRSKGAVGSGADAAHCVAQAAVTRRCQLIVVGSHGRTALQRLLYGSLAASLLPLTPVPMLVCRKKPDSKRQTSSAQKRPVRPPPEAAPLAMAA